ncbi:hypothetical protein EC174750_0708 [Escherichia coli 174750]|nr:hypothetical protein EC174750_0708 [Escherichia coli 174750]
MISHEELKRHLSYDPETGVLPEKYQIQRASPLVMKREPCALVI